MLPDNIPRLNDVQVIQLDIVQVILSPSINKTLKKVTKLADFKLSPQPNTTFNNIAAVLNKNGTFIRVGAFCFGGILWGIQDLGQDIFWWFLEFHLTELQPHFHLNLIFNWKPFTKFLSKTRFWRKNKLEFRSYTGKRFPLNKNSFFQTNSTIFSPHHLKN